MKFSTKSRYAVLAMMEVALRQKSKPVTLADISEKQGISVSYLEQLFARLRKTGLVKGTRGPGGGYCLARPLDNITIAEIVTAVEDKLQAKQPIAVEGEQNIRLGLINEMWEELSHQIHQYLSSITLGQFVNPHIDSVTEKGESEPGLKVIEGGGQWVA